MSLRTLAGVPRCAGLIGFLALASIACSSSSKSQPAASPHGLHGISDDSLICKAVTDRFVGIPELEDGTTATQSDAVRGRWWIRGCSAKRVANGIRLRFEGPGWYFLDRRDSDFEIRQQVTFTLGIGFEGAPELTLDDGVARLRFETKTTPEVELQLVGELSVHATSAWGSLVSIVPGVSVQDRVAERLSALAVNALRNTLRQGATATYEIASGQSDVALGKLAAGQTPRTAFTDRVPWLVNERLFLAPNATQVVGPIDPGPTRLDARVERGEGLAYRTVCQADMPAEYQTIANGHLNGSATRASAAHGTLSGLGEHSAIFRVDGCKFFVVLATLDDSTTVAALRVRG